MTTTLRHLISAMSSFDSLTQPIESQKASYSKLRPKIGCHGNVPQYLWTSISHMIPWAHPSPQPKRHLDRFSRFCRDDRRVSLYFTMGRPFGWRGGATGRTL